MYNVGVFDIPRLQAQPEGYLACTTDDILREKPDLYDLFVELPSSTESQHAQQWPKLYTNLRTPVKATQRDFRRYRSLMRELKVLHTGEVAGVQYRDDVSPSHEDEDEAPLLGQPDVFGKGDSVFSQEAALQVVESESWSMMAYQSLMWWASADEMAAMEEAEAAADQDLLRGLHIAGDNAATDRYEQSEVVNDDEDISHNGRQLRYVATTVQSYFERSTTVLLQKMKEIVTAADNENEAGSEGVPIEIFPAAISQAGLDAWSQADRDFFQQAMKLHFQREAVVKDEGVSVCGLRIC
jgi:hypothetical protein